MGYDKKQLKESMKPLYGFGGKRIESVGVIAFARFVWHPIEQSHGIHNLRCG
jgi:hypothetical protein